MVNKIMYQKSDTIEAFTFYSNDSRYDELIWAEEMTKTPKIIITKYFLKLMKLILYLKMSLIIKMSRLVEYQS